MVLCLFHGGEIQSTYSQAAKPLINIKGRNGSLSICEMVSFHNLNGFVGCGMGMWKKRGGGCLKMH